MKSHIFKYFHTGTFSLLSVCPWHLSCEKAPRLFRNHVLQSSCSHTTRRESPASWQPRLWLLYEKALRLLWNHMLHLLQQRQAPGHQRFIHQQGVSRHNMNLAQTRSPAGSPRQVTGAGNRNVNTSVSTRTRLLVAKQWRQMLMSLYKIIFQLP